MTITHRTRRVTGAGAALLTMTVSAVPPASAQEPTPSPNPTTESLNCTIQTRNTANYLTAVNGGGRITDVIHTDATSINPWETFQLNC